MPGHVFQNIGNFRISWQMLEIMSILYKITGIGKQIPEFFQHLIFKLNSINLLMFKGNVKY